MSTILNVSKWRTMGIGLRFIELSKEYKKQTHLHKHGISPLVFNQLQRLPLQSDSNRQFLI